MNFTIDIHHHFHRQSGIESAQLAQIVATLDLLQRTIAMNQAELVIALDTVKATLVKVGGEIDAFKTSAASDTAALQTAIAALEAELANASGVSPEASALVAEIQTLSAALDGKIEDLPAVVPVP